MSAMPPALFSISARKRRSLRCNDSMVASACCGPAFTLGGGEELCQRLVEPGNEGFLADQRVGAGAPRFGCRFGRVEQGHGGGRPSARQLLQPAQEIEPANRREAEVEEQHIG